MCIHIFFDVHRTYKPQEEGACITFLEFVKKVRALLHLLLYMSGLMCASSLGLSCLPTSHMEGSSMAKPPGSAV